MGLGDKPRIIKNDCLKLVKKIASALGFEHSHALVIGLTLRLREASFETRRRKGMGYLKIGIAKNLKNC
jgi:hypothetical protein